MFKYYVDVSINFENVNVFHKNTITDYLFNTFHGIFRSKKYQVGLSFPKFSTSQNDRYPTLGRVFRLVANNFEDLQEIVSRNSIDNLVVKKVLTIGELQKVPEEFVSYYVFKRHNPRREIDKDNNRTKKYVEGSIDECVPVNLEKDGKKVKIYIKRVRVGEKDLEVSDDFTTYGLGNHNGPSVPVF